MDQLGTVLVFKPGVTPDEVRAALRQMDALIDHAYYMRSGPPIHSFDMNSGGPVWYIP